MQLLNRLECTGSILKQFDDALQFLTFNNNPVSYTHLCGPWMISSSSKLRVTIGTISIALISASRATAHKSSEPAHIR